MRTSPRTTAPVQALIQRGFRFEVLRYGPANGFVPEPVDLRLLANPPQQVTDALTPYARPLKLRL
ncbi:hypothetical protein ABZ943_37755, partial [Streptomyces rubiginosohelvolus]|uniref:hypothetical protein n=1 Tax=Streptomyces rubiginosohelvolus TaxID=67362 RepID=UPI0033E904CA